VPVTTETAGGREPGRALRLRPLRPDDEAAFRAAHQAMTADGFSFGFGLEPDTPWDAYLKARAEERAGVNLRPGRVPGTMLVADLDGEIVGRSSIRHTLNEELAREGGHIGYGVLPAHRRRGYATEILRQSLIIARSVGVDRVLVTCDDDNVGSIAVIERCGGQLESVIEGASPPRPIRRYWID
jgi:predicted acetyltransferase